MSIVQSEKNGDITCSPTAINSSPTDILPEIKWMIEQSAEDSLIKTFSPAFELNFLILKKSHLAIIDCPTDFWVFSNVGSM